MSNSEKIYRYLLRAYPRDYRSRYAVPMEQLFRDRLREVRGVADLLALWCRMLADWAISVPTSYWEAVAGLTLFRSLGDPARRCIFFARCEASSFSRTEVTVDHLLLGVLRQEPGLVPRAALDKVVRTIEAKEPAGRRFPPRLDSHAAHAYPCRLRPAVAPPELSEEAIRVVAAATEIAHTAGRQWVSPADLADGILREPKTLAARLLREHMTDQV